MDNSITGERLLLLDSKELRSYGVSGEDKSKLKKKIKEMRLQVDKEKKEKERERRDREKLFKKKK